MPHFDYCSHAWSNCSYSLSNRLQVLMNNLARIILSADIRTSIDSMMNTLDWLKLDQRWNNSILIMLFKCLTGIAPNYLCSMFNFTNTIHDYCTRGNVTNMLVVPRYKSNSGLRTFHVRAANLWNKSVDGNVRSKFASMTLGQFKSLL